MVGYGPGGASHRGDDAVVVLLCIRLYCLHRDWHEAQQVLELRLDLMKASLLAQFCRCSSRLDESIAILWLIQGCLRTGVAQGADPWRQMVLPVMCKLGYGYTGKTLR